MREQGAPRHSTDGAVYITQGLEAGTGSVQELLSNPGFKRQETLENHYLARKKQQVLWLGCNFLFHCFLSLSNVLRLCSSRPRLVTWLHLVVTSEELTFISSSQDNGPVYSTTLPEAELCHIMPPEDMLLASVLSPFHVVSASRNACVFALI